MAFTVLIVDDERTLGNLLLDYFKGSNFTCEHVTDKKNALDKIRDHNYDCLLVDIGLPDGSGLGLIREVRQKKIESGIIVISAQETVDTRVEALNNGADDYLTKPFHLSELNARINALIRRNKSSGVEKIEFNEITIIPEGKTVMVNNRKVLLTAKEFDLLLYLVSNKNKVLTKDAISFNMWSRNADMDASNEMIYTHIKNLRKKLIEAGSRDYIHAIYRVGYKFSE